MHQATQAVEPDLDDRTVPTLGPDAYASELRGMTNRAFCFGTKYAEQQGRAVRQGAHPEIIEFERKLVKRLFKLGVPLFAHCMWRDMNEQTRVYVSGRSKARWGDSPHNYGAAVDIIHGTRGWDLTRKQWGIIGHIGKELAASMCIKVTWGGDWEFYDPAHWERMDWRFHRNLYRPGEAWDGRTEPPSA